MTSIIIPAHNEEKVISKTLTALRPGAVAGDYEIIVVCNGCTDGTAKIVGNFGNCIQCLDTPVASKAHALNLGDRAATSFPRFYLDADIVLSPEAIEEMTKILSREEYYAVSPVMQMDYNHSSWAVRFYYDIWQDLPYVQLGLIGTGVYALSKKGRSRFDVFPEIIADDRFVRALFLETERTFVPSAYSIVRAPTTLNGLIKIKTRSRLGGYEFEQKFPQLVGNEKKKYSSAIIHVLLKPSNWPKLPIYLFVNIVCRIRAKHQLKNDSLKLWERDESSRY